MENVKAVIEALVFASESPLSVDKICEVVGEGGVCRNETINILRDLMAEYDERNSGFYLKEVAGGFQFRTRGDFGVWIKKLKKIRPAMLTTAAMETLAVIAYKQPVMKSEIDRIRGVDAGGALSGLLEKNLVKMVGRKDVPGRPILYGTTRKFLEVFDLKNLSELPTLPELKELSE